MTDINLVVNGTYETADGTKVRITDMLKEGDPTVQDPEESYLSNGQLFNSGYRFLAENGDSYLPNGRYDVGQETSLDLIKPVISKYLIISGTQKWCTQIEATDPLHAIAQIHENHKSMLGKATEVYELLNVTPSSLEKSIDGV